MDRPMTAPLDGVRVVELGGIGPAPFCGMMLAGLGADVTAIGRAGHVPHPVLDRDKTIVRANLKEPPDRERVWDLVREADVAVEGFRPGVAERLGYGPADVAEWNSRIVYGRITGFGRSGPLADRAGHDINYIAMSGVLGAIGPAHEPPSVPLNLVADFGGGGMVLALGIVAALRRVTETGRGEVVDTAMVDGSAALLSMIYGFRANGRWTGPRGGNLLDGGAPYYRTYACSDGRYVAVGAIEPQFFANLVEALELSAEVDLARQPDPATWPAVEALFASRFRTAPRDHWARLFAEVDACVTPVLDLDEAPLHPHNVTRETFASVDGIHVPRPPNRFSPLSTAIAKETIP